MGSRIRSAESETGGARGFYRRALTWSACLPRNLREASSSRSFTRTAGPGRGTRFYFAHHKHQQERVLTEFRQLLTLPAKKSVDVAENSSMM